MTPEELLAAIKRRGYRAHIEPPRAGQQGSLRLRVARGTDGPIVPGAPDVAQFVLADCELTEQDNATDLPEFLLSYLSGGQEHVACSQCGTPLLCQPRAVRQHDGPLLAATTEYTPVYRAVQAGPASFPLTHCPRCQQRLDLDGHVRAIEDPQTSEQQPDAGWSEQQIAEAAEITPEDLAAATALWNQDAPDELNGLLEG